MDILELYGEAFFFGPGRISLNKDTYVEFISIPEMFDLLSPSSAVCTTGQI